MRIADLISDELVSQQQHLGSLCQALVNQVSEEELRMLCSDLTINYDDLPSGGRAGKARELIKRLDHDGQIPKLVEAYQQLRLSQALANRISKKVLRALCCCLAVDYDDLPGGGRVGKARELVKRLDRHRLLRLVEARQQLCPSFSLDITSESEEKFPQPSSVESRVDEEPVQSSPAEPQADEEPSQPSSAESRVDEEPSQPSPVESRVDEEPLQPSPDESQADEESSQPPFAAPVEGEQPDETLTFRQNAKRTGYETARRLCRWALIANQRVLSRRNLIPLWRRQHGEPVWLDVPAGEFWMGRGEKEQDNGPAHRVYLGRFQISKVPITVAQYRFFVEATGYPTPLDWVNGLPQRYWRNYPAVYVSWHDALAYCKWLSEVTGKSIILPSEAQWEKAARGHLDCRVYPWGDEWNRTKCNTHEFGRDDAMPVGILRNGASPYGCLDMAGQVWEWTTSLWGKAWSGPEYGYPYDLTDGRENPEAGSDVLRVVRGGSFVGDKNQACCTHRAAAVSDFRDFTVGFRAVNVPVS
jgi:formylglycine-generating enzyme required for sulfatase activity